ncbi:MAG: nucleotidyltransferase domain-containing protein [Rhizobiaceae bacterium]
MDKAEIINRINGRKAELKGLGVTSLALFGSRARGSASENSDADFLVRFDGEPGFDRYMDTKLLLETALGIRVDLVTENALRHEMRATVTADLLQVA